jgi:predicted O-methyltransferase YrrM
LLASTAITIIAIGSGAGASTLWFLRVLKRHDLRLAFASD